MTTRGGSAEATELLACDSVSSIAAPCDVSGSSLGVGGALYTIVGCKWPYTNHAVPERSTARNRRDADLPESKRMERVYCMFPLTYDRMSSYIILVCTKICSPLSGCMKSY